MFQNLYQYAFAFSDLKGRFLIYTMSPRSAIPCSDLLLGDGRFGHIFAVEDDENGIDPAILFDLDKSQVVCSEAVSGMPSEESHVTRIMEFDDKMAEHSSNSGNI